MSNRTGIRNRIQAAQANPASKCFMLGQRRACLGPLPAQHRLHPLDHQMRLLERKEMSGGNAFDPGTGHALGDRLVELRGEITALGVQEHHLGPDRLDLSSQLARAATVEDRGLDLPVAFERDESLPGLPPPLPDVQRQRLGREVGKEPARSAMLEGRLARRKSISTPARRRGQPARFRTIETLARRHLRQDHWITQQQPRKMGRIEARRTQQQRPAKGVTDRELDARAPGPIEDLAGGAKEIGRQQLQA